MLYYPLYLINTYTPNGIGFKSELFLKERKAKGEK